MRALLIAALLTATPALAEVKSVAPNGFAVAQTLTISSTPDAVYALLAKPALWWDGEHSYSHDSANLALTPTAGGCFCETWKGGSAEHARVALAIPGRILRVRGAFGPLQGEGVDGALTWQLKAVPGGTEVSQTYVVGGYLRMGMEAVAPAVDGVMTSQLQRLKAAAERPAK